MAYWFNMVAVIGSPTVRSWFDRLSATGEKTNQYKAVSLLNQYQGGMCISGNLTMTERTPRRLISPLGPSWVGIDSAV